jgi:eukaryotic translation initiation factor 2C
VVVRMQPNLLYPYNSRSFFTEAEKANLGMGLEVWRGYFQSVRPAIGRLLINIDISSALMYNAGPLAQLCLNFFNLNANDRARLSDIPQQKRRELQRFLTGVKVTYGPSTKQHTIFGLGRPANQETFPKDGQQITVAAYFQGLMNRPLQFPNEPCVQVCHPMHFFPTQ